MRYAMRHVTFIYDILLQQLSSSLCRTNTASNLLEFEGSEGNNFLCSYWFIIE